MCKDYPHRYQVQSHSGGWALGRCKWCRRIEPFRDSSIGYVKGKQILPTSAEKRRFLRSLNIPVSRNRWDDSEVQTLIDSVKEIGMNQTAKQYEIPVSTLHLWTKGLSPTIRQNIQRTSNQKLFLHTGNVKTLEVWQRISECRALHYRDGLNGVSLPHSHRE